MPPHSPRSGSRRLRLLPVVEPYRLDLTVAALRRFSSNVVDRVAPDGRYLRAFGESGRPVIVAVAQREPAVLEVELAGPARGLETTFALVERMLGTSRDVAPFGLAAERIPWLRGIAGRMRGVKPPRYPSLWEACVNAVAFQQVSLLAASAIVRRLVEALGTPVESGDSRLYVFPSPLAYLAASEATIRGAGLSANKFATLRRIAVDVVSANFDEAAFDERTSSEASDLLQGIKGIGPWTAAVVLLRGLGRLDVFPPGDSGVARSLSIAAGGVPVDMDATLQALGQQRGMLYYHLLLARLEASGELGALPNYGASAAK